jgi:Mrp family chromosome partitioning ATPase
MENMENNAPRTGSCESCKDSSCSAAKREQGENDQDFEDRRALQSRLCHIGHKIMVMSGKGGVGKSTVAVNLAMGLMLAGKRVGLLDVDIHGPSVPTMLGLEGANIEAGPDGLVPVELGHLKVMSMGFLLRNPDDAVIWRGPVKGNVIKQFLKDVAWGDLDYLIIDAPPGTGDEPLSICQLINPIDGAVVVTTPQRVAAMDVRKSITFCAQVGMKVLGVVENMSGFVCPKCGELTHILRSGGGRLMAEDMGVPFLGSIPIDPMVAEAGDMGQAFVMHHAASPTAELMRNVVAPLLELPSVKQNL